MMKRLALIVFLLLGSASFAEDVPDLIKQLDSQNFLEREQAAAKLQEMGEKAIPALTEAANKGSLETSVRSVGILKKLMESSDKGTAEKAKAGLEELAKSENAGTAKRAKTALEPKPAPQPVPGNVFPLARIRGNIAMQNNALRISVRTVNGVKTIEVSEGQRELKIVEDPNKGITLEITETKNGKKATEKIEAKDADDLKKKHPQAYKDYEKYNQPNAVRVQFGGAGGPLAARVAVQRQILNDRRLEMAGRLLQTVKRNVDQLVDDNTIKDADNPSREALKKDLAQMRADLLALEKKLQDAIDADAKEQKAEKAAQAEKPKTETE